MRIFSRIILLLCFAVLVLISAQRLIALQKTDETPQQKPVNGSELQQRITTWAQNHDGDFGVAVQEINGAQRQAYYQADKQFVAASTYKLFLVYAILHDIEQGNHTLDTKTSIGIDVHTCIDELLIRSDNDCGYPTGALIGWETINTFIQQQGFHGTDINNYDAYGNTTAKDKTTTAKDQVKLMSHLANGTLLNKTHTDLMLTNMKQQVWRERIPAGVPTDVEVADKPGWLPGIENDTAIVYGPKSIYAISILSTNTTPNQLAELSKLIYDYLQR